VSTDEIAAALRKLLSTDESVDALVLFGSAARGQLREDSDIDVAVRWRHEDADHARAYLDLLGRLGQVLPRDVHLVDLASAGPELRRRIYAEGVVIVDHDPRRTRDDHVRALIEVADWEYARTLRREAIRSALSEEHG
jgi:predicted nucleotidyltransferase